MGRSTFIVMAFATALSLVGIAVQAWNQNLTRTIYSGDSVTIHCQPIEQETQESDGVCERSIVVSPALPDPDCNY